MGFPLTINLDVVINSFGGVGTSFLMHFLKEHLRINCPHNLDLLKHIDTPPLTHKKKFRAVYIYGNPIEAIASLFNRGYHSLHSQYLLRNHPKVQPVSKEDTLETYLKQEVDRFKLESHFEQWISSKRHYPILFIKYEYIWNHLPELFNFLEIDHKYIDTFPKKKERTSRLDRISNENLYYLDKMYGTLIDKTEQYPAFFIKPPTPAAYPISLVNLPLSLIENSDSIHPAITLSSFYPKTYNLFKHLLVRRSG